MEGYWGSSEKTSRLGTRLSIGKKPRELWKTRNEEAEGNDHLKAGLAVASMKDLWLSSMFLHHLLEIPSLGRKSLISGIEIISSPPSISKK